MPADEVGRVADSAAQEEPRRLERAAGDDDRARGDDVFDTVGVEVADAFGALPAAVEHDLHRDALRSDLARAARE